MYRWQERRCARLLHVLVERTLVEGVSAVLDVHQAGLELRGLLECKAIGSHCRVPLLLAKPLLWKPGEDSLCFGDALHFATRLLLTSHPFSQHWSFFNRLSHDMRSAVRHHAMTH
jgi:hypothetical protein